MEIQIIEPDKRGWEVVYKNGKLYEKKKIITGNCTINIYNPIPFEKPKKPSIPKALVFH
mgnify:CR=1 FL=1